jgi:type III secretory pathway component EscU
VSWAITLFCLAMIYMQGINIITPLFWFKLVTLGIIVLYINSYKYNEFYYYQNLGISKRVLWISTLLFDIILFVLLVIIIGLLR